MTTGTDEFIEENKKSTQYRINVRTVSSVKESGLNANPHMDMPITFPELLGLTLKHPSVISDPILL